MLENKINYIFGFILITILFIITSNNIKSIFNYTKGVNYIKESQTELQELESKNLELKEMITTTESNDYLQKLAIEELNLASENATILIIPEENTTKTYESGQSHSNPSEPENFSKWIQYLKLR
jgi:cell division protein FtsB